MDPAAIHDLAALRTALAPLEAAREEFEPPAPLWAGRRPRVAEHIVNAGGPAPPAGGSQTEELIRRAAAVAESTPTVSTIAPSTSEAGPPPLRRRNAVAVLGLS